MLENIISKIRSFFESIGKKLWWLIALAAIIIVIIAFLATYLNQSSYSVLYSGMDPADAGEVLTMLEEMNVDARVRGDDTILVKDDEVDTVRMQLAAQGFPNSGVNYEIFQNASGLGVTDMERQVYYEFQLQYNLQQTIIKMDKIQDAVVNVNLEEDSSFVLSDDETPASAAVMLMLDPGTALNADEVKAIAELVSKSVPGLQLEDVRIVDSQMNLYNIGDQTALDDANDQSELQQTVQNRLQQQVISLLTPVFGPDNILAEVHVLLNFDDIAIESVEFTPEEDGEGIVVSMKEIVEVIKNDTAAAAADGDTGVSQYLATADDLTDAVYYQQTNEANYEINETKTIIENAKGQIEDLSVAIIINMDYEDDTYKEKVIQLVASAIGVEQERVTVEMFPFVEMEQDTTTVELFATQQDVIEDIQGEQRLRLILILIAVIVGMIIIGSIFKTVIPASGYQLAEADGGYVEGIEISADEEITPDMVSEYDAEGVELEFKGKDRNVAVLEDYSQKNPESVANLLRNWLNEEE